jgi:exosortase/archaeosortase family protein
MIRAASQQQSFRNRFVLVFRKYSVIILVCLSVILPMALLYYLDAPSFDKTWKGRTYYMFFVWLFAMELILNWENLMSCTESKRQSVARLIALIGAVILPTIYVVIEYFYGLNTTIANFALQSGIGPTWAYVIPLSIEYLVFALMFAAVFLLAYGFHGLKDSSISISLLTLIGVVYMIDNLLPDGAFTPFQIIVPTTAKLAAGVLSLMGFSVTLDLGSSHVIAQGMPYLAATIGGKGYGASIAWSCSGVDSLLIYTVVMLLFLKKSDIPLWQKITFFGVGAATTYFINILRIVTFYVIGAQYNPWDPALNTAVMSFHDYYGPLYSIVWITSYPLIIIGVQILWKKIRPAKNVMQNDLLPKDTTTVPHS